MEDDLIKKSIETGELQLPSWQKRTHFEIVFWSFGIAVVMPLIVLFYHIYDSASNKNYGVLWFSPVFAAVGMIFISYKKSV